MATFTALRRKPELVTPARPTPHEYKALSDIDDQRGIRFYPAGVEFFRASRLAGSAEDVVHNDDPVKTIRAALSEALVSYYPLAGCLVELSAVTGGKLLVDCTAEGVVFVEADADVRLEELGDLPLTMPYPCVEELLCCDVGEPQDGVVGKPLLFFQVTRFRGNDAFSIGYRFCHCVIDAFGMSKFLNSVYTLARGEALTEPPVWGRELLMARAAPHVTHRHSAYEELPPASATAQDVIWKTPLEHMVTRHFRFGPRELAAMRSQVSASLLRSTTAFDLVAAAVWQSRTAALGYDKHHHQCVRVVIASNARGTWKPRSPLPQGFYGNALVLRAAEATAGELSGRPLGHAAGLVRETKSGVTDDEYMQSMLDFLARRGRPSYSQDWTYVIADVTSISRRAANLVGWERAGGGITTAGRVVAASLQSYYLRRKGRDGEEAAVVSMCLPPGAMEKFAQRISAWGNMSRVTSSL